MGLRKYKRNIAKARMKITGFDKINKNFGVKNPEGEANWRTALKDEKAHMAQIAYGLKNKRKIRKIERTA